MKTQIILTLCVSVGALSLQSCTRSIHTSQLAAPKVNILNMGPNIPAGQVLKVNYTAVVPENKTVVEIQVSQKLDSDTEFKPIETISGNPGSFYWTAPAVPQPNVQIQVKAVDNRRREGASGESPLMNIVRANILTETTSANSPPTSANGGTANYGGECTLGYSVRVSIVAVSFGDRVSDTAPTVIPSASQVFQAPCVDNGQGSGTWSYSFVASSVNPTSPYASYSYVFDVYDTASQQPITTVSPIGRVWLNTPSLPSNPRLAFKSLSEYLSWHYSLGYMNSAHGGISFAPLPSNAASFANQKLQIRSKIRDFISLALGQTSYDAWSEATSADSWQFHALEQSGLGYYLPYYSFTNSPAQICAALAGAPDNSNPTNSSDCETFMSWMDLKVSYPNDADHAARLGVHYTGSSSKPLAAVIDVDQGAADHSLRIAGLTSIFNTVYGNTSFLDGSGETRFVIRHQGALSQFIAKSDLSVEVLSGSINSAFLACAVSDTNDCVLTYNSNEYTGAKTSVQRYILNAGSKVQFVVDLLALNSDPNKLGTSRISGKLVNTVIDLRSRISSDATYLNRFIVGQEMISSEQAFANLPLVDSKFRTGAKIDFDFTLKEDLLALSSVIHADRTSPPTLSVNNQVILELQKLDWNSSSSGTSNGSAILSSAFLNEALELKLAIHSSANSLLPFKLGEGTLELSAEAGARVRFGYKQAIPGPLSFNTNSSGAQVVASTPSLYTKPYSVKNLGSKPVFYSGTGSYTGTITAAANAGGCVSVDEQLVAATLPAVASFPYKLNSMVQWYDTQSYSVQSVSACD